MASVVLSQTLAVSKPGLKAVITFKKADCLTLGSKTYVCFKPNNAGLCQMMVEANGEKSAADIKTAGHYSCWHSLGLQELIKLRNEAQVKALSEADGKTCTLFEGTSRPAKKPRVSHAQMKTLRDDHDALTVQASIDGRLQELIKLRNEAQVKALSEADGKSFHAQMKTLRDEDEALTVQVSIDGQEHSIDVLRPVHGRDRLWVLYEESSLGAVITYLRDMPFGDKLTHAELPDGVTGVIKRTNGWIVKKKRDDGSVQHMLTKQLDDAAMLVNSDAGARDGH